MRTSNARPYGVVAKKSQRSSLLFTISSYLKLRREQAPPYSCTTFSCATPITSFLLLLTYIPALRKGMWRTKGLYIQTIKDAVTDTREHNAYKKAKRYDKIPLHGVKAQKGGTLSKNNGRAMLAPTS